MTSWLLVLAVCCNDPAEKKCACKDMTVIGGVNQGGYQFEYQSGWGDGCLVYRVRNTPTGLLTPVHWRERKARDSMTFLDLELEASDRRWRQATHITNEAPQESPTYLGFGVNKDQHSTPAVCFRANAEGEAARPVYITILEILEGEGDGAKVVTGVRATSKVEGEAPQYKLTYSLESLDDGIKKLALPSLKAPLNDITVVWDATRSKDYLDTFNKLEEKLLTAEKPMTISISAPDFDVLQLHQLRVYNPQGRVILGTSAPIYVPRTAPR